ncbi:MAG: NUDIX hydrolase [Candidatus Woesearchaeota archaeon]
MEVKVSVIIKDAQGRILLQRRDQEPEKDKWVLFGGSVEKAETEKQALLREIEEELNYKIKSATFFGKYSYKGIMCAIYIVDEPVSVGQLTLHEGSEMRFFEQNSTLNLPLGFNTREILEDFHETNQNPG